MRPIDQLISAGADAQITGAFIKMVDDVVQQDKQALVKFIAYVGLVRGIEVAALAALTTGESRTCSSF